jgi:hypothetical protein
MSQPLPNGEGQQTLSPEQVVLLSRRVQAVQTVAALASEQAGKLMGHARQLEGALDGLAEQIGSLPDASRIKRLGERLDSLQAMLDWLATNPSLNRDSLKVGEAQTRLSACRVALVNVQAGIQQAAELARQLRAIRGSAEELTKQLKALEPVQEKAEVLGVEAVGLSAQIR